MPDFWRDSGFHLVDRDAEGYLRVGDALLRAYFHRPEVAPIAESCSQERALHAALLEDPRRPVGDEDLARFADPDAQENYRYVLAFRDQLLAAGTLEACYLGIFRSKGGVTLPPLFIDQLVHLVLRNILDGSLDGLKARAGELFFREQAVTIDQSRIMVADQETVQMYARSGGFGSLGRLITESQTPLRTIQLDILDEGNADLYWGRDQAHDTVLDLSFAGAGLDAFCRVLEAWIAHFTRTSVAVQPVQKITDERWVWHIGLDSEASQLLNDLYQGNTVESDRLESLLSLFRLEFADPRVMLPRIAGRPVYLGLCMHANKSLKLKPQNVLINLPLVDPI